LHLIQPVAFVGPLKMLYLSRLNFFIPKTENDLVFDTHSFIEYLLIRRHQTMHKTHETNYLK